MRGRRPIGDKRDHFGDNTVTHEDVNAHLRIASLEKKEAQRIVAKSIAIEQITPSRLQPRRAIPSALRAEPVPDVFETWRLQCSPQTQELIEMTLSGQPYDPPESFKSTPIEDSLIQIVDLAVSIRESGLTNPITVVHQHDNTYQIETGERRWLAYHLLNLLSDGNDWSEIPARIMDTVDVWRQASENSARQNLNAIGIARQLALLLMDLYGMDKFAPIDDFTFEQEFYAQVADGNAYRIPRGKSADLLAATGLKHPDQLRHYRTLLRLDPDVWIYADDHNVTEGEIRNIKRDTVTPVTVKPPTLFDDPAVDHGKRLFSKQEELKISQKMKSLASIKDGVGQAKAGTKLQIRQVIDEVRAFLDQLEGQL